LIWQAPFGDPCFYRAIKRLEPDPARERVSTGELWLTDLGLEAARAVLLKDVEEPKH